MLGRRAVGTIMTGPGGCLCYYWVVMFRTLFFCAQFTIVKKHTGWTLVCASKTNPLRLPVSGSSTMTSCCYRWLQRARAPNVPSPPPLRWRVLEFLTRSPEEPRRMERQDSRAATGLPSGCVQSRCSVLLPKAKLSCMPNVHGICCAEGWGLPTSHVCDVCCHVLRVGSQDSLSLLCCWHRRPFVQVGLG